MGPVHAKTSTVDSVFTNLKMRFAATIASDLSVASLLTEFMPKAMKMSTSTTRMMSPNSIMPSSMKIPPMKYWKAAARRMTAEATPVPIPAAMPLRMSCCMGKASPATSSSTLRSSRPKADTVRICSNVSEINRPASTAASVARPAYFDTTFACKATGTTMRGMMPNMMSVNCQEASKAMYRPARRTTTWEIAMEARSPVSAFTMKQSLVNWFTKAPAVCDGEASNQPMLCRRMARKARMRTRTTIRSVITAKLYWRSMAPMLLTTPKPMKTNAQNRDSLRISATSGLKKTMMNSAMRKPIAGKAKPVIAEPRSPLT
mmetsp:Transcript_107859/g.311668  ORF Transcript_107859/g.311668 Transcript_107859/m.311668 type:complete len:317 (-) Transcript_107859:62-1012(-)